MYGWTPQLERGRKVGAARPRWFGKVDIDAALDEVGWVLDLFERARAFPEAPLFSGGTVDCWPARAVEGLAICRQEYAVIRAYEASEAVSEVARG